MDYVWSDNTSSKKVHDEQFSVFFFIREAKECNLLSVLISVHF